MADIEQFTPCPLCTADSLVFYEDEKHLFYQCLDCCGIFRSKDQRLSETDEIGRYLLHRDPEFDEGYHQFIRPIIEEVRSFAPNGALGLDYGCGKHKVLMKNLAEAGYNMFGYDPLFLDDKKLLKQQYDFIVSCEVIEHFFYPFREFQGLKNILAPRGKLVCKTDVYDPKIDFENWYYKNDPTHVFIYREETFEWIRENLDFKDVKVDGRVITFSK